MGRVAYTAPFLAVLPIESLAQEQAERTARQSERERQRLSELSQYLIPGQTKVVCRSDTIGRVAGTYKGVTGSSRIEVIDDATHVVFSFRPSELHL